MQITQHQHADRVELALEGRIDANWSDYLSRQVESLVESGCHQIDLNLERISYISSAGVAVLVRWNAQLRKARGELRVVQPSSLVAQVLKLSGLLQHLTGSPASPRAPEVPSSEAIRSFDRGGIRGDLRELARGVPPATVAVRGEPQRLEDRGFANATPTALQCDENLTALGLLAFGESASEARGHFGEGLAVAGAAMVHPADGSEIPDYQLRQRDYRPRLQMLYGLEVRGEPAGRMRFEAQGGSRGVIGLSELLELLLDETGRTGVALTLIAESACVIGASLRKSPDGDWEGPPWEFPRVRDWLSFTTERTTEKGLVVVVGVATRHPSDPLVPCLRPASRTSQIWQHCHAALFPYRPVPQTEMVLPEFVSTLFQHGSARSVLHLVNDERPVEGLGETDLLRGTVWFSELPGEGLDGNLAGQGART